MTDLTKKRIYLLDMDGTLYLGEQLFAYRMSGKSRSRKQSEF